MTRPTEQSSPGNASFPEHATFPKRGTFPKQRRLLTGAEFDAVFAAKLSVGDGVLIVYGRPNEVGFPRLGMAVSKKVGNAVRRNRWKRLLREAFRLAQHELPPFDWVCLPRLREEPSFSIIDGALRRLTDRVTKKAAKRLLSDGANDRASGGSSDGAGGA